MPSPSENGHTALDQTVPERLLVYFNRVGRSLHEGESIEFPMPNGSSPAHLTSKTRRLLVQRSEMTELTLEATLQAFRPGPSDNKQMSVYDGDQITAAEAWSHYANNPSKPDPSGVLAITHP